MGGVVYKPKSNRKPSDTLIDEMLSDISGEVKCSEKKPHIPGTVHSSDLEVIIDDTI